MSSKVAVDNRAIFRSGAWAGQFADAYITDTELEGGLPEIALQTFAVKLVDAAVLYGSMVSGWTDALQRDIAKLADTFAQAGEFCLSSNNINNNSAGEHKSGKIKEKVLSVTAALSALRVGEILLLPAGWMHPKGGHAVLLAFRREGEERFSMTVCNSGAGLQYHPSTAATFPKTKFRTAMHIDGIHRARLLTFESIYMVYKLMMAEEGHGAAMLYDAVIPHLAPADYRHVLTSAEYEDKHGDWDSAQLAGTCYYRSILVALRYCLRRVLRLSVQQTKQFMFALRLAYLRHATGNMVDAAREHGVHHMLPAISMVDGTTSFWKSEVARYAQLVHHGVGVGALASVTEEAAERQTAPFSDSDVKLILVAVQCGARAVAKLQERGFLGTGSALSNAVKEVAECATVLKFLSRHVCGIADHDIPYMQPLVDQTETDVGQATTSLDVRLTPFEIAAGSVVLDEEEVEWQGFDLLANVGRDVEPFAGGITEGAPDLFADLRRGSEEPRDREAAAWNFDKISDSIALLVDQCDSLRARAAANQGSGSMLLIHQIIALIEDLVHFRVPHPAPGLGARCPWQVDATIAGLQLDKQRRTLDTISKLGQHYFAAIWSIQASSGRAPCLLTLAALVVWFDTAARRFAVDKISPLAAVLAGLHKTDLPINSLEREVALALVADQPNGLFGISLVANGEVSFQQLIASEAIEYPQLALTRQKIQAYVAARNHREGKDETPIVPFLFGAEDKEIPAGKVQIGMGFVIQAGDGSSELVEALCSVTNRSSALPPALEAQMRTHSMQAADVPEAWRISGWFVEDWLDVPDFAQYRDLVFQFRYAAAPLPRNAETKIYDTGSVTPKMTSDRGQAFVYLFGRPVYSMVGQRKNALVNIYDYVIKRSATSGSQVNSDILGLAHTTEAAADLTSIIGSIPTPPSFLDPLPTEEDVALTPASALPTFSGTLSKEDAARLASLLTADHLRIPLILDFFSGRRTGALLDPTLRGLVQNVLFDPHMYSESENCSTDIRGRPEEGAIPGWAGALHDALGSYAYIPMQPQRRLELGCVFGALMSEIIMNPQPIVQSALLLLHSCRSLCTGDYRSPFMTLFLWVNTQIVRLESFIAACNRMEQYRSESLPALLRELREVLREKSLPLVSEYLHQAEAVDDVATALLLHSAIVLIFTNESDEEMGQPLVLPSKSYASSYQSHASDDPCQTPYFLLLTSIVYINSWFSVLPGGASEAGHASRAADAPPYVDVYRVFQRHREGLIAWSASLALEGGRDTVLTGAMQLALRRKKAEVTSWVPASALDHKCQIILESPHPCPRGIDMFKQIRFPGAAYLKIRFDDRTHTEPGSDYVAFYKDPTYTSLWGKKRFSGQVGTQGWPGAGGQAPLIIPGDTAYLHFHTDATVSFWGFRCTITAPISEQIVDEVTTWAAAHVEFAAGPPANLCALVAQAVADAGNDGEAAKKRLSAIAKCEQLEGLRGDSAQVGLYADAQGKFELNLQTGEVYVRKRLQNPVPLEVASHPDYRSLFDSRHVNEETTGSAAAANAAPSQVVCTVISTNAHRKWLQLQKGSIIYDIQQWLPLSSGDESLLPEEIVEFDTTCVDGLTEVDDAYVSHGFPRVVEVLPYDDAAIEAEAASYSMECFGRANRAVYFSGQVFRRPYGGGKAQLGAAAELVDRIVEDSLNDTVLDQQPFMFLADASDSSAVRKILIFLPPQGDAPSMRAGAGAYFELQVHPASAGGPPLILAYQIIDHARTAQRVLVYASDGTLAHRQLDPESKRRWRAWTHGAENEAGFIFGQMIARTPKFAQDSSGWSTSEGDDAGPSPKPANWPWLSDIGIDISLQTTSGIEFSSSESNLAANNEHARRHMLEAGRGSAKSTGSMQISRCINVFTMKNGIKLPASEEYREIFLPCRVLSGLVPDALLQQYEFWFRLSDSTHCIVGYPRHEPPRMHQVPDATGSFNTLGYDEEQLAQGALVGKRLRISCEDKQPNFIGQYETNARLLIRTMYEGDRAIKNIDFSKRLHLVDLTTVSRHSSDVTAALRQLQSIEAASHTLCWARAFRVTAMDGSVRTSFLLERAELPRLRQNFQLAYQPTRHSVRIGSLDNAGLYVCSRDILRRISSCASMPFCMPLMSDEQRLYLMVPSIGISRPLVREMPFSCRLLPQRSWEWVTYTQSRVFLFPAHHSLLYITPSSLSACIYLFILHVMSRNYIEAARIAHMCASDAGYSEEQLWMFQLLFRSAVGDTEPSALALRLRSILLLFASFASFRGKAPGSQPSPYGLLQLGSGDVEGSAFAAFLDVVQPNGRPLVDISQHYERYIQRYRFVPPHFRLSAAEEVELQALVAYLPGDKARIIEDRDSYLLALTEGTSFNKMGQSTTVPGGLLWSALGEFPKLASMTRCPAESFMYQRPNVSSYDELCLEIMQRYKETIGRRGIYVRSFGGFVGVLYECLTGTLPIDGVSDWAISSPRTASIENRLKAMSMLADPAAPKRRLIELASRIVDAFLIQAAQKMGRPGPPPPDVAMLQMVAFAACNDIKEAEKAAIVLDTLGQYRCKLQDWKQAHCSWTEEINRVVETNRANRQRIAELCELLGLLLMPGNEDETKPMLDELLKLISADYSLPPQPPLPEVPDVPAMSGPLLSLFPALPYDEYEEMFTTDADGWRMQAQTPGERWWLRVLSVGRAAYKPDKLPTELSVGAPFDGDIEEVRALVSSEIEAAEGNAELFIRAVSILMDASATQPDVKLDERQLVLQDAVLPALPVAPPHTISIPVIQIDLEKLCQKHHADVAGRHVSLALEPGVHQHADTAERQLLPPVFSVQNQAFHPRNTNCKSRSLEVSQASGLDQELVQPLMMLSQSLILVDSNYSLQKFKNAKDLITGFAERYAEAHTPSGKAVLGRLSNAVDAELLVSPPQPHLASLQPDLFETLRFMAQSMDATAAPTLIDGLATAEANVASMVNELHSAAHRFETKAREKEAEVLAAVRGFALMGSQASGGCSIGNISSGQLLFSLLQFTHVLPAASWPFLIGVLLSQTASQDVVPINHLLADNDLNKLVLQPLMHAMLLHINKCHALTTSSTATRLLQAIKECTSHLRAAAASDTKNQEAFMQLRRDLQILQPSSISLAKQVAAKRTYLEVSNCREGFAVIDLDPRLLYTEYHIGSLLRPRQVTLIRDFMTDVQNQSSRIEQAIMGLGKTYVIAPLLALMLADGASTVVQVMPTQLVDMSREAVRGLLCSPAVFKQVLTYRFDRTTGTVQHQVAQPSQPAVSAKTNPPPGGRVPQTKRRSPDPPRAPQVPACLRKRLADFMRILTDEASNEDSLTWPYMHAGADAGIIHLACLHRQLVVARRNGFVVCSSPDALKSTVLRFCDLLQAQQDFSRLAKLDCSTTKSHQEMTSQSRSHAKAAQVLRMILSEFKGELLAEPGLTAGPVGSVSVASSAASHRSVAILDEVDFLMHPLRSELNFPTGKKHKLPLAPKRWQLPMFLMRAIFASASALQTGTDIASDVVEALGSSSARKALADLPYLLQDGLACRALQDKPHVTLLNSAWYKAILSTPLAHIVIDWLSQNAIGIEIEAFEKFVDTTFPTEETASMSILTAFLCGNSAVSGSSIAPFPACSAAMVDSMINDNMPASAIAYLNLAKSWITSLVPHVLSKVDRVNYGLLNDSTAAMTRLNEPLSRLLLAVPFVGKDVPSYASEYSHPDIRIGLTFAAYTYEGLRAADTAKVAHALKQEFLQQSGVFTERPSRLLFQSFVDAAKQSSRGVQPKLRRQGSTRSATVENDMDAASAALQVLPLEFFQPHDPHQQHLFYLVCRNLPATVDYYLDHFVFPATTDSQIVKFSASGHDLGSDMLFHTRIGFTGTPNEMVPLSLLPVRFESASEASVLATLHSPDNVDATVIRKWDVMQLLRHVATCETPKFNALIDIGALITGLNNKAVVAALLLLGLHDIDGAVFLDENDRRVVLLRPRSDQTVADEASVGEEGEEPLEESIEPATASFNTLQQLTSSPAFLGLMRASVVPLGMCGIPKDRLFTFFDSYHSTGTDIPQAVDAVAAVTLGKDTTFRDYAQGAYRMRGLGQGQRIHILLTEEIETLAIRLLKLDHSAALGPSHVIQWLLLNSIRTESLQHLALINQRCGHTWRLAALHALKESCNAAAHVQRFDIETPVEEVFGSISMGLPMCAADFASECLDAFMSPIDHSLQHTVARQPSFVDELHGLHQRHSRLLAIGNPHLQAEVAICLEDAHKATAAASQHGVLSHDTEQVQEQEQQQEQQKEQQEERMDQSAVDPIGVTPWHFLHLVQAGFAGCQPDSIWPWTPLRNFVDDAANLPFSTSALLSSNHTRPSIPTGLNTWQMPRRLRDVSVVALCESTSGVRTIALSLREAETIRKALYHLRRLEPRRIKPESGFHALKMSLRIIGERADVTPLSLITAELLIPEPLVTKGVVASIDSNIESQLAQLKLFDGSIAFSKAEIEALLGVAEGIELRARLAYFESVRDRRHRDNCNIIHTPTLPLFTFPKLVDWLASQQKLLLVGEALRSAYGSLVEAFTAAQGTLGANASPGGSITLKELTALLLQKSVVAACSSKFTDEDTLVDFVRQECSRGLADGHAISTVHFRLHEFIRLFASHLDVVIPTSPPMLQRHQSSTTSARSAPGLIRLPSNTAPLTRQQSRAVEAAAASAAKARQRGTTRAFRRALLGAVSLAQAADFGTFAAIGFGSEGSAEGSSASPLVWIDRDGLVGLNRLPIAAGIPPKTTSTACSGNVAVSARGIVLTDGKFYFEAVLKSDATSQATTPMLAATQPLAGVGVVPTGYTGGTPGVDAVEFAAGSAAGAAALLSALNEDLRPVYVLAHDGKLTPLIDPAGTPLSAAYGDRLGCAVDLTSGTARAQFTLNGAVVAASSLTLPPGATGTLPVGWMSTSASNSVFPVRLKLVLGASPPNPHAYLHPKMPMPAYMPETVVVPPSGHSWARRRVHDQLATTMIRQAGPSVGQLVPTSGGSQLVLVPPPKDIAASDRHEWKFTGVSGFPSAIFAGVALSSGRWYWEAYVTVGGLAQVGWADVSFIGVSESGLGVGDDKSSWAYDGNRIQTWHDGSRSWGKKWRSNDVIGFVADLDAKVLSFGLNGDYSAPMGHAFLSLDFKGGLAPALTVQASQFAALVNFGQGGAHTFRQKLPAGCRPIWEWIEDHKSGSAGEQAERLCSAGPQLGSLQLRHLRPCVASGSEFAIAGDHNLVGLLEPLTASSASLFTSTVGQPTVLFHPEDHVCSCNTSRMSICVERTGEFSIGFAHRLSFTPSWSEQAGIGDCPFSMGVKYLPCGVKQPALCMRDTHQSYGLITTKHNQETYDSMEPSGVERGDLKIQPGLYSAFFDAGNVHNMVNIADMIVPGSVFTLERDVIAGLVRIFLDGMLLAEWEADADWVPGITVSPQAVLGIPNATCKGCGEESSMPIV